MSEFKQKLAVCSSCHFPSSPLSEAKVTNLGKNWSKKERKLNSARKQNTDESWRAATRSVKKLANRFLTEVKKFDIRQCPHNKMSHLSMTYLTFDGVIGEDIKELVEDFKPGQVAEKTKKCFVLLQRRNVSLIWHFRNFQSKHCEVHFVVRRVIGFIGLPLTNSWELSFSQKSLSSKWLHFC